MNVLADMRRRMPYAGLGMLVAVVLTVVQGASRLAPAGASLQNAASAHGFFCGLLVCSLAFAATSAVAGTIRRNSEDSGRPVQLSASIAFAVIGTTLIALGLASYTLNGEGLNILGIEMSVSSLVVGMGCALGLQAWIAAYSHLDAHDFLASVALAHLAAAACWMIGALVPDRTALVAFLVVLGTLSGITALRATLDGAARERESVEAACKAHSPAAGELSLGHRIATACSVCWYSVSGLIICAFLFFILIDQTTASLALPNTGTTMSGMVGPMLVAAGVYAAVQRWPSREFVHLFFRVAMPVAAAIFLITPNFASSTNAFWDEAVRNLQNASTMMFCYASAYEITRASRTSGFSVHAMFSFFLVLVAVAALAGTALYALFGRAVNIVPILLFVAYLTVALVLLAAGEESERQVRQKEKRMFDDYLRTRCAQIAENDALTARETEILMYLGRGHTHPYIASALYISENTVRTHARQIYKKTGVGSREELLSLIDSTDA